MTNCPVCKKPLYGPVWEGEDGTQIDLACADALIATVLDAANAHYTRYAQTVAETLMKSAADRLEPPQVPPMLRLIGGA